MASLSVVSLPAILDQSNERLFSVIESSNGESSVVMCEASQADGLLNFERATTKYEVEEKIQYLFPLGTKILNGELFCLGKKLVFCGGDMGFL